MVFASLFFVFVFLTLNLLSQLLLPKPTWKNVAMLMFSLVFYTWTGLRCTLLMLLMVFICKVGAVCIEESKSKKIPLAVTISLCLGILGIFKYAGFAVSTAAFLTGENFDVPQIVLPVGISFYTFQLISYVVDVYREEIPAQRSYWRLLLYACLFHQCIAGPIVARRRRRCSQILYGADEKSRHRKFLLADCRQNARRWSRRFDGNFFRGNFFGTLRAVSEKLF